MDPISTTDRVSRGEVATALRHSILTGGYAPGAQIPTRETLAEMLGASYVTVQRGLDRLRNEGFVRSRRGSGTFIVDHPPHTCRYILVMPTSDSDRRGESSHFRDLLVQEAALVADDLPPKTVEVWPDIDAHDDNPRYRHLLDQTRRRCLAGLLFPNEPYRLKDAALLRQAGIGMALVGEVSDDMPFMPGIRPDITSFVRRACQELARQGRRRLAAICPPVGPHMDPGYSPDVIAAIAAEYGLSTRPSQLLPINALNTAGTARVTTLLLELPPTLRPDAIIFFDDHMVEPATRAVRSLGLDVPAQLGIIAYANFPSRPKLHVPARLLGFDIRRMLRDLLPLIDMQLAGAATRRSHRQPAIFEEELPYR